RENPRSSRGSRERGPVRGANPGTRVFSPGFPATYHSGAAHARTPPGAKDMSVTQGEPIVLVNGRMVVPDQPVIPFIEGDGTGPDIWRASVRVLDAAVAKAYGGRRRIAWHEVLAGQKAFDTVEDWLPEATLNAFRTYRVGIKGPLTTPIGGGIRSL